MAERSAEVAVIGGGPAGAHLAAQLAATGREVAIFDPKGAWEKPCGGGVPTRALREFSFLLESTDYPRNLIRRIRLISPAGRVVAVPLDFPFAIYSREVLNRLMLDRATGAGAEFVRAAVADFSRCGGDWSITTGDGRRWRARFLVGADGAASFTRRRLVGIFPARDLALAFGYNVATDAGGSATSGDEMIVQFPKDFTGYLWAFPRPGVMNFGVFAKLGRGTSDHLRAALAGFVSDYYKGEAPEHQSAEFFGAKIPTLHVASWAKLKTVGSGWALVGDAAGFVDPITGEGIYYALKSADLLAAALGREQVSGGHAGYDRAAQSYEVLWRDAFGRDLEQASYRLPQFYHGSFLGHVFTDLLVRLARHHRGVKEVLKRTLTGEQSYLTLRRDLLLQSLRIF
jgi:geranylgeranyl reductase family protein